MKVYFLTGGYDGCYYVRCLQPLIYNGWWGAKTSMRSAPESIQKQIMGASQADIVVFQRPMQKEMLEAAKILKLKGKKIVYDNDDTYRKDAGLPRQMKGMYEEQIDAKIEEIDGILKEFVSIADLVTTTTEFLADEYRPLNPNTIVLPNMVDPMDWRPPIRNEGEKVRIGLVGSVVNNQDYAPVIDLLKSLEHRDDVTLVCFGLPPKHKSTEMVQSFYQEEYKFWESLNIEWQPFVEQADYNDTLNKLALDIMLIPRADNYFNRCKSNVKFLEAAMCEIPVIAQGFPDGKSPYEVNPDDAKHMIIIKNPEEWVEMTEALIKDKDLRRSIGKEAREYVIKNYNINETYVLWRDAFRKLLE